MADYYSLISRAIAALPQQTPDTRQAVYERARKALYNQLRSIQPPVAEADIAAEGRALEEAITRLELESTGKGAPEPQTGAPPAPAKPTDSSAAADKRQRPQEPSKKIAPNGPGARTAEEAWRETLDDASQTADSSRSEPQRPAAPLPLPPQSKRPSKRTLALAGVFLALIAVVGGLAWWLRERPEDLAKLKPEETAPLEGEDAGKFGDRVEGGASAPAPSSRRATSVPVAQKAELWVASAQEPNKVDRIYNATVIWRLENVGSPGETLGSAIRGDVDVPEAKMKMSLIFRKNTDSALSASHTINVSFKPAADSPLGGVKAIGPIQMRRADAQAGEKVIGIPVPITANNFLIGLMRGDREARNIQLLRSLAVLDLPLQLNDGRAATINMEKGPTGERVFADAIDSWSK
ncbi:MAG: hypothetical protein CTY15_03310 [Methylocystis sp.]|nr:MAG: hypothetical protein CTY15_03310 [Methylocystis sp.]